MYANVEGPVRMTRRHVEETGEMLARAFHDDPPSVWLFPDEEKRRRALRDNSIVATRYGLQYGEVYSTPGASDGAAIWLTADDPMPSIRRMLRVGFGHVVSSPFRFGFGVFSRFLAMLDQMEKLHKRDVPARHWYLMTLGVDPARQGQGVGSTLIQPGLARADRDRVACYLETAKEINVKFYRKHGFEVVREVELAGGGPPLWTMKRDPIG